MRRQRLDDYLLNRGSVNHKSEAFIVVTEGRVFIDGQKAISPAQLVGSDAKVEVREERKYVGRGALKLEAALDEFKIDVSGKICADVGSATGGFTEVLLKRGAKKVYAIDTARGKLALKLREDPRVVVMERRDVRDFDKVPEVVDVITIDVSLISLREILVAVKRFLKIEGEVVALFKPQYETRDQKILKHGVIREDSERENLLSNFKEWTDKNGWGIKAWIESPIRGSEGNIEYLINLRISNLLTSDQQAGRKLV